MSPAPPHDADPVTADWSDRRADARRNHERVVAAALEVFAERGLEATVPEVAARAGVGKATVYRSFPTKDDLVAAVARHEIAWLTRRIAATPDDDAFTALRDLLADIVERVAENRVLAEILPKTRLTDGTGHQDRVEGLLDAARRQGTLREDATSQDIKILISGCCRVLIELGIRDRRQWRRYAVLSLNALRP
ncbi:TetR family transcriptional regulator [Actinocorallia herbida]|uniref:TetR family transcriptional regulator n=1 Tax=Actinocorallia herbida TaxID=58109 RepID=A0A3N1CY94_9ACTN|nr:TetR/AcrR family transcriptional regulator [Actinocorallia herbida]ROO86267.1 TetR family transcriptional regulator [Actinocorallia herbida]